VPPGAFLVDEKKYEQGWEIFTERFNEILNTFATYGVRFAMEVHPTEIAYNIDKFAHLGFGVIELGVASENPPFDRKAVRGRLKEAGLECCVCSYIPADRDIASSDPGIRRRGVEYMKSLVATTSALGGSILCGPLYAELFRARYLPATDRHREWENGSGRSQAWAKSPHWLKMKG
jgi:sugar phosphate isomerase/epimerase